MEILKNGGRVSRIDGDSSPASRGSASTQEDDDEPCTRSAKAESFASDSSDVDSGMESDEFDPAELGQPGTQLCQVGNQSFSVPLELYDLPDLGSVLSLQTWNECLMEEERLALSEYLPDMDRETFGLTLKELFSGANFHFGSPLRTIFNQLKGGLGDPKIVLYRKGLVFMQQREHYLNLCKYQNSMVARLVRMRDAWQNYAGYGIDEKLQLLKVLSTQRSLNYEANGDVGYETDSQSRDSDDWYLNRRFKMGQQFVKPSFGNKPYEAGIARQPVKHVKEYTKGVLKVAAKVPKQEYIEGVPRKDKSAGYDVGTLKRIKPHVTDDPDDIEEGYVGMGSHTNWNTSHRSAVARNCVLKTGKKQGLGKRYDGGMYGDGNPEGYNGFSQSHGKRRQPEQVVTVASYGSESPDHTKAKYFERGMYPATFITQNHKQTLQKNKMHEIAISSGHLAKSGRAGKGYRDGVSYDLKNKSNKPPLTLKNLAHLRKDSRAKMLQGRTKNNTTQYDRKNVEYSMDNTMISESDETESDSSDQAEEDGDLNPVRNVEHHSGDTGGHHAKIARSSYDSRRPKKREKVDNSNLSDVDRSVRPLDVELKGNYSRLAKKAKLPRENLSVVKKRHKGVANMDPPQSPLYADYYGNGQMVDVENLDHVSKLRGNKNLINRLENTLEVANTQTIGVTQERSNVPLVECKSLSKKTKKKVEGRYLTEQDESLHLKLSPKQQIEGPNVIRKGKRKAERKADAETETLTVIDPDWDTSGKVAADGEPKAKLQKKTFTLITPTIHSGFSFSIIHLLSAVRKAMITPHIEDTMLIMDHLQEDSRPKHITDDQKKMHHVATDAHLPHSVENVDRHSLEYAEQITLPSLTVQEIVDRVKSNPGDPYILETQEPLQDLVRGVLKIFSSKTAPLGAKGWKPLVLYEKSNKSWSWAGPVTSTSSDNDNTEEETSSEAWGIPHKMLVKMVDAFANWLKSGQVTLQQIGSLPPPPTSLLSNMDEKDRFKDLRAQKSLNTISPSSDEVRAYFRKEEFLRYSIPDRVFSYTAADGKKSIVAPLRRGGGKPTSKARDHFMLKPDRPPHVTILCLVRDAAARLPGSIGTRADVCTLLRDSQYIVENVSDAQLNQIVSGALDRLHYERDPCVQFDNERKLWVYLHKDRDEEDFEDDGTSSTKKWKRQTKESLDQSDNGIANDVGGTSTVFGDDHDLHIDTSPIRAGGKAELVSEKMGTNMVNTRSHMVSRTVRSSHGNWEILGLNNPHRENRVVCRENSTVEVFDDETFSQEKQSRLQYDLVMKNG